MDKKENEKRKRILLLLLLMIGTIVLLSTSTYAWFTANKTVTVDKIQVNVEAQGGIQISENAIDWKGTVTKQHLLAATGYTNNVNQIPDTLKAVSSATEVANGKMKMFLGNVDGDQNLLTATADVEQKGNVGNFIAFDLFFKVDQDINQIYLTPTSNIVIPDGSTDTGIKNAARIAFYKLGTVAIGSTPATAQALNQNPGGVSLWEPNYDVHTAAAVQHANSTYGISGLQTTGNSSPVPYAGIKAEITNGIPVGDAKDGVPSSAAYVSAMTPTYATVNGFTESKELTGFTLSQGITKVRFYMWVEGQDVDCENQASGGSAVFNFQLTTVQP